jgi:hypothetical protein
VILKKRFVSEETVVKLNAVRMMTAITMMFACMEDVWMDV